MDNADNVETKSWIRMPRNGERCTLTGLSHGRLYRLIAASGGSIRTVSLKEEGQDRGTRLIDPKSLLAYLDRLAASQQPQEAGK